MSLVAAIDLGTTTARAGLFDRSGARVAVARQRLDSSHPFPGAVEQDPAAFVTVTLDLLSQVLEQADADVSHIAALAITNQRSTIVAWDADTGEALRPAIGWQDTRTAVEVAGFVANGIPLTTSASCSKLAWMMREDQAVRAAVGRGTLRLGTVDSWLTWALSAGAAHVTDPSNAGATGLYDLGTGDWSRGALQLFAIPRSSLATIVGSDEVVAVTDGSLVGAEIPLAARVGDQQAACVAHDITESGAKLTLGTSAMLDVGSGRSPAAAPPGSYTLPLWRRTIGGEIVEEFMVEGSVLTAGAVVEWLVSIGLLPSVEHTDEMAHGGDPGLTFVPALAGLGSPWQDPDARGLLAGIGLHTRPADIVRAALVGIGARIADLLDAFDLDGDLRVDGGLSRSRFLLQEIADTTGRPVRPAIDPETSLRGAAMLAATSPGVTIAEIAGVDYDDAIAPRTDGADRDAARAHHEWSIELARDVPAGTSHRLRPAPIADHQDSTTQES